MTSWEIFAYHYGIKSTFFNRFKEKINLIESTVESYPIVLLPKSLSDLSHANFSVNSSDETPISFKYLINFDKIKQIGTSLSEVPLPPNSIRIPKWKSVSNEIEQHFKTLNFLNICKILAIPIFAILLNVFFCVNIEDVFAISLFILLAIMPLISHPDFWLQNKSRTVKISQEEREMLQQKADYLFNEEFNKYTEEINEFHDDIQRRLQLLQKYNYLSSSIYHDMNKYYSQLIAYRDIDTSIDKVFSELIMQNCKSNGDIVLDNTPPQKGRAEDLFFYQLMQRHSNYILVNRRKGIYFPDIVLSINGSFIDVEIDEPYSFRDKKEIHYIGSNDSIRNEYFINQNWFVIRFSEMNILSNIEECINIVDCAVNFINTGNIEFLSQLLKIKESISHKQWTIEQARMMAISNSRNKI